MVVMALPMVTAAALKVSTSASSRTGLATACPGTTRAKVLTAKPSPDTAIVGSNVRPNEALTTAGARSSICADAPAEISALERLTLSAILRSGKIATTKVASSAKIARAAKVASPERIDSAVEVSAVPIAPGEIPAVVHDGAAPAHVVAPVDPARTSSAPFIAVPAAIQPEQSIRAETAIIDRPAVP